ncbi:MAG: hypothetical protein NTY14_08830 [Candidatus Omnitrophica bacterium]|nr:hypothetical protein [Candidatus Omnitrophota bacterium]
MENEIFDKIRKFLSTKEGEKHLKDNLERVITELQKLSVRSYARNVIPESLDCLSPIYRIETLDNFSMNVKNKTLYFGHPKNWLIGDKLDSIILRKKVILPDGSIVEQKYFEDTFCQCWSKKQSRKMWEEYGKDKEYKNVAMVSNVDKIMRTLESPEDILDYSETFWVGEVSYLDFNDDGANILLKTIADQMAFFKSKTIASCYLEKRSKYDFEDEIRFIADNCKLDMGKEFSLIPVKNDFKDFLDGIILDPRLVDSKLKEKISQELQKKGFKIIEGNKDFNRR